MQASRATGERSAVQLTEAPQHASPQPDGTQSDRFTSAAVISFVAALAFAFGALMWLARGRWFKHDEWDFLAAREATSLHDLFAPHVVHWSTLPILAYRLLWTIVGLRTYVPYVFMSVSSHLAVAVMLRVVMRRAGVRPWTATVLAVAFMFFGAGYENIILAFGMTFSLAIVFGLVQLVLSDHDGRIDRRDYLGLLAGLVALLCSGIAVTMVFTVGVASLVRRGWRAALFHTAPLAGVYGVWYLAIGSTGYSSQKAGSGTDILSFAGTIADATFHGLSQFQRFGWVLLLLVVATGLALAWSGQTTRWLRRHASLPAACLAGCAFFIILTAIGRWDDFQDMATPTRYVYVAGSLLVVPVGVAADAIMRRWRFSVVAFACLLAVSLVGNVRDFPTDATNRQQVAFGTYLLTLPRLPVASQIPDSVRPDLARAPWVTMGWLRAAVASGRAPVPGSVDPVDAAGWEVKLALRREQAHTSSSCIRKTEPTDVRLARGASIKAAGGVDIEYTAQNGAHAKVTFPASGVAPYLVAYAGPLDVRVTGLDRSGAFMVCDEGGAPLNVPPSSLTG